MNKILVYSIVICALTGKVGKEHEKIVCVLGYGVQFSIKIIIKEKPPRR